MSGPSRPRRWGRELAGRFDPSCGRGALLVAIKPEAMIQELGALRPQRQVGSIIGVYAKNIASTPSNRSGKASTRTLIRSSRSATKHIRHSRRRVESAVSDSMIFRSIILVRL